MAVSTIGKEFIAKEFTYTFPSFPAGTVGSRIDFHDFGTEINGYKVISATIMGVFAGVTFLCTLVLNGNDVRVIRTRASGTAESGTYTCSVRVLYQKN